MSVLRVNTSDFFNSIQQYNRNGQIRNLTWEKADRKKRTWKIGEEKKLNKLKPFDLHLIKSRLETTRHLQKSCLSGHNLLFCCSRQTLTFPNVASLHKFAETKFTVYHFNTAKSIGRTPHNRDPFRGWYSPVSKLSIVFCGFFFPCLV